MECLGGNGYVEEGGHGTIARIYREMPVNSIWEGAGNIQALDLLRALRSADVAAALAVELAPARGGHLAFDRLAAALPDRLDGDIDEAGARRLARDVALLVQATLLRQHAGEAVFAAFCAGRLDQASDAYGQLPAGIDFDALIARALPA
jgi:putative acyl-CoA dehydrogenase